MKKFSFSSTVTAIMSVAVAVTALIANHTLQQENAALVAHYKDTVDEWRSATSHLLTSHRVLLPVDRSLSPNDLRRLEPRLADRHGEYVEGQYLVINSSHQLVAIPQHFENNVIFSSTYSKELPNAVHETVRRLFLIKGVEEVHVGLHDIMVKRKSSFTWSQIVDDVYLAVAGTATADTQITRR